LCLCPANQPKRVPWSVTSSWTFRTATAGGLVGATEFAGAGIAVLQEALEAGGREHEEIVILGVARITQLVGDVARGDESIAFPKNKDLVSDDEPMPTSK
jgi:hypothetical protein